MIDLLGWCGTDALLIRDTDPKTKQASVQRFSLWDHSRERVAIGRISAASPDGSKVAEFVDAEWRIKDLKTNTSVAIGKPEEGQGTFEVRDSPVWSADGRHIAIGEVDSPVLAAVEPIVQTISGVHIVEVGATAKTSPRSTGRLTVVDCGIHSGDPLSVRRWTIDERIGPITWHGATLYYSSAKFDVKEPFTTVCCLEPADTVGREIYRTAGRFQTLRVTPSDDGRWLALGIDVETRYWDAFVSIVLVDPATGKEERRLTHDLPINARSLAWIDNSHLIAITRQGGLDQVVNIALDGTARLLTHGARKYSKLFLSPDRRSAAVQTEDLHGRRDIRILDLGKTSEEIVWVTDDPTKEFNLGKSEHMRWLSADGISPFGYVIYPPDFDPTRKYPMLVDVHGGGAGSDLYLMAPLTISVAPGPLEWHAWAALGYVVFVPDYRSTGYYGAEPNIRRFKEGRDPVNDDAEDVITGTRHMIKRGYIDPNRVAILGHSAGGARVFNILTRSSLFAAACLNEGVSPDPLTSMLYLTTRANTGREFETRMRGMTGAPLKEAPERYKVQVVLDSYKIKAPTLIMMGSEKLGGADPLPYEMLYSILKSAGTPTRMISFVDEGHVHTTPESSALAFNETKEWFKLHLGSELPGSRHD